MHVKRRSIDKATMITRKRRQRPDLCKGCKHPHPATRRCGLRLTLNPNDTNNRTNLLKIRIYLVAVLESHLHSTKHQFEYPFCVSSYHTEPYLRRCLFRPQSLVLRAKLERAWKEISRKISESFLQKELEWTGLVLCRTFSVTTRQSPAYVNRIR
jgi:hypothetical protein